MEQVIIDNQPVKIEDTKTVISFKSPQPQWAKNIFNIWVVASMITGLAVLQFADYIPDRTEVLIDKILLFSTGAVRIITKSFGLAVDEVKS